MWSHWDEEDERYCSGVTARLRKIERDWENGGRERWLAENLPAIEEQRRKEDEEWEKKKKEEAKNEAIRKAKLKKMIKRICQEERERYERMKNGHKHNL